VASPPTTIVAPGRTSLIAPVGAARHRRSVRDPSSNGNERDEVIAMLKIRNIANTLVVDACSGW